MLGGPTPDTVVVEYDEEEVDRCAAAAKFAFTRLAASAASESNEGLSI
jgi:hypothetical protein